jgi:uncharacterized membrane protein YbaN (DUF454 family)
MFRQIWKILGTSMLALAILFAALSSTATTAFAAAPSSEVQTNVQFVNVTESFPQWIAQYAQVVCNPNKQQCRVCIPVPSRAMGYWPFRYDYMKLFRNGFNWPFMNGTLWSYRFLYFGPMGRFVRFECVPEAVFDRYFVIR